MDILRVIQKAKGLLLTITMLFILNCGLLFATGIVGDEVSQNFVKYLALTIGGFALISFFWNKSKRKVEFQKLWVFYRMLSLIIWLIDIGIAQGFLIASNVSVMLAAQVIVFLVYLRVLQVYDRMLDEGDDYLLTEDIRPMLDRARTQNNVWMRIIQKSAIWVICTFWFGSDILTLLLRKGKKTTAMDIIVITLPSSIVGTAGTAAVIGLIMKAVGMLL